MFMRNGINIMVLGSTLKSRLLISYQKYENIAEARNCDVESRLCDFCRERKRLLLERGENTSIFSSFSAFDCRTVVATQAKPKILTQFNFAW